MTKPGAIGRMSGDAKALPECLVKTPIHFPDARRWVWPSQNWSVFGALGWDTR